jgi:hypothetical protein
MTTAKTKRWMLVDAPAERLLDAIGARELEYYSAADERAFNEALTAWPLLAMVARTLGQDRTKEEPPKGVEQSLRVVVPTSETTRLVESEQANDGAPSHKEAG